MNATESTFKTGLIAIVGRPNVGKSTLMNRLIGAKVSIATPKPQTTRNRILGVITHADRGQFIFVDTPGIHRHKGRLNKRMVDAAYEATREVDAILFVIEAASILRHEDAPLWGDDEMIAERLAQGGTPVVLALNKVDKVKDKTLLLPRLQLLAEQWKFDAWVPMSAKSGSNMAGLETALLDVLPVAPAVYEEDMLTDRAERWIAGEMVRESLFMQTGQEIPYSVAVVIERFAEDPDKDQLEIDAVIHVERESQKGIIIGKGGKRLKAVGMAARRSLEDFFGRSIYLKTFVRVEKEWTENTKHLDEFGYGKDNL